MKPRLLGTLCAYAFTIFSVTANAVPVSGQGTWETTLQGRDLDGNNLTAEAYYDTVLDITWVADANINGEMDWFAANAWAAGLDINGFTGWRLPIISPVNGVSLNTAESSDATTDVGTAPTTTDGTDGGWRDSLGNPVSEMGHMYYVTLANIAGGGLVNTGPFSNLETNISHWSGTEFDSLDASNFGFDNGYQGWDGKDSAVLAWAVRDGDGLPAVVPVPAAVWLFGSGLLGLVGMARRKKA